jgi:rhodanese-related sulfurtransferase
LRAKKMVRLTIHDLLAESRRVLRRLEPHDAYAAMREGALVVDTRSEDERRKSGRIPGAHHVALSVLEWRIDPASEWHDPALADPSAHVILVCSHGYASSLAASRLQEIGFSKATDVIGGFEAWKANGLPVVR